MTGRIDTPTMDCLTYSTPFFHLSHDFHSVSFCKIPVGMF